MLKLELFRSYIREWIPVFLTRQRRNRPIHIYDFFSGPGQDSIGHPGSPMIVLQELQSFCNEHTDLRVDNPSVTLHFSDSDPNHIACLKELVERKKCSEGCCRTDLVAGTFTDCLNTAWPVLQSLSSACLVIMDQCGLKEVTPSVVNKLAECPVTDILFFISSSYIRRFATEASVQKYFDISADELQRSEFQTIHRYICDYFRSQLPENITYYLAPFSIRKSPNIYGIIFGTGSYLGLSKFLSACWKHDGVTGEANYPVDEDPSLWGGNLSLFPEFNVIKKFDIFRRELEVFLRSRMAKNRLTGATNHDVFEFTLQRGFLPKHARAELKRLQDDGRLNVVDLLTKDKARKGSFYISWDEYRDRRNPPRVILRMDDC